MATVAEAAGMWQATGVSTIPIANNTTKRPALSSWAEYQARTPLPAELNRWWGNGRQYGLALIMGRVSGNAEMTELEGRACDSESMARIEEALDRCGARDTWDLLFSPDGYSELSPSGGIHLIYRVKDHPVPGNVKIASRPATAEEQRATPGVKFQVLAETRGEGGYVIVAPTPGICHPSGEAWAQMAGTYGQLPVITWDQRNALHAALHEALHIEPPQPVTPPRLPAPRAPLPVDGVRPGDDFEAKVDWADELLLGGAGWQVAEVKAGTTYWTRAGKSVRDGISATTGRDQGRDRLYVFSTSTEFPDNEPVTKFRAYSLLHHNGNDSAAASTLSRLGFGTKLQRSYTPPSSDMAIVEPGPEPHQPGPPAAGNGRDLDDMGNAERLWDHVKGRFHWVPEEKSFYVYDGTVWRDDYEGRLTQEWGSLTKQMLRSDDEAIRKWATRSRSYRAVTSAQNLLRQVPGVSRRVSDFDPHHHKINCTNGVLDLKTGEFSPSRAEHLMTRTMGTAYNPAATAPRFDEFLRTVLPDPQVREYVQRAVGATLLGDADQRALFIVHGPSGTGKSQFTETMRALFGDYGATAASSTFRARMETSGPTPDLHRLRGKRFVSTSETSELARFDEDLLKRISGRDSITSRGLFKESVEWTPECHLWIATNHAPRFTADDDAVWRRVKLLPFMTRFGRDGMPEIPDYARKMLIPELPGILNWALEGVRLFLEGGLDEPETVTEAAADQRREGDPVARFIEEQVSDEKLLREPAAEIEVGQLHLLYLDWCRRHREPEWGRRRFVQRITSNFSWIERTRSGTRTVFRGIRPNLTRGIAGTIGGWQ